MSKLLYRESKLVMTKGPGPDPLPNLLIEDGKNHKGVGPWVPEVKHTLLAKYIDAAHAAAASKWKGWVLIDPFCGPGRIKVKGEDFTRDGGSVIAWRQSVASGTPFAKVLIGDKDPARVKACIGRLEAHAAPVTGFAGPAVETVPQMVAQVPPGHLCLAYIDPYNLEYLDFEMIKELSKLRVDFIVHFSDMDCHRNADMEMDPKRARFDQTMPGWRNALSDRSRGTLVVAAMNYWMQLVQGLDFKFAEQMPLVKNDSAATMYRLVFFARHDLPKRLWNDVARGGEPELPF
jgi:three-Cys-motif partner protein